MNVQRQTQYPKAIFGYVVAFLTIMVIAGIGLALKSIYPNISLRAPYIFAVGIVAYLYGIGPGMAAFLLSVAAFATLYTPLAVPEWSIPYIEGVWLEYLVFSLAVLFAVIAMSSLHTSKERLVERTAQLEDEVRERKRARDEILRLNAELEQRVIERTAELQAANKELEAFSYSVSHDLRAPLRAIDGFSNTLLEDYKDSLDERGQDYLQRVRNAAQRMGQLIDDILGLSRATRAEMRPQQIDMSDMAGSILDELHKSDPDRKVEVSVEPGLIVTADAHLLNIALQNLIGNAWKFTAKKDVAHIEIGGFEHNAERVYYIRDNGAGFNPDYADKLFSPFQRLHTESEFPGTGIGLALAQRIIRRHGGRIWAEGAVDQGATFYFTIA